MTPEERVEALVAASIEVRRWNLERDKHWDMAVADKTCETADPSACRSLEEGQSDLGYDAGESCKDCWEASTWCGEWLRLQGLALAAGQRINDLIDEANPALGSG